MSRLALSTLVVIRGQPSPAVGEFAGSGQSVTLVLIMVVVVALALTLSTARDLGRLVALILAGLWTNLKLLALLALILLCLLFVLVRGA